MRDKANVKLTVGHEVYCPVCKKYVQLVSVNTAAKIAAISRRTVYRYIESGLAHSVKIAGKTLRVCTGCLFDRNHSQAS